MLVDQNETVAVVGASADEKKYGNKVLKTLLERGFKVIPVNLKGGEIHNQAVYKTIADYPFDVNVVVTVVPPNVTNQIMDEAHEKGVRLVWMQPGSESPSALKKAEEYGISTIHDACIMNESAKWLDLTETVDGPNSGDRDDENWDYEVRDKPEES